MLSIKVINEQGTTSVVRFQRHSYHNLMELIVNELYEDIGDCRGKAWCGTCHVEPSGGRLDEDRSGEETSTLGKLNNATKTSRLSCQIMVDQAIDGMVLQIMGDC